MTRINNKTGFDLLDKINHEAAIEKGTDAKIFYSERVNACITSEITGVKPT